MSLRKMLGADADRVHEQVAALLDSEDAMIVLVDGSRAISYACGFGISSSQLELLALEIEGAVRSVAGPPIDKRRIRRTYGEEQVNIDDSGGGAGRGRGSHGAVALFAPSRLDFVGDLRRGHGRGACHSVRG